MTAASSGKNSSLLALTLGSVGVVYGDIGTSPLYAFREALAAAAGHGGAVQPDMVLGVLSLILWALLIIVTFKYVLLLMRADNQGEGGILSLMALTQQALGNKNMWVLMLGIAGAALFYGDAIITPAISVLSAVEGLKLITPVFEPYILLISTAIIVLLFAFQYRGTQSVSKFFAPIMILWFLALGWGGLLHITEQPLVLQAFNPYYALHFFANHGFASFIALGAVFLAVTGAEALYTDMGHFGRKPIRLAWMGFVMPALMLNYFGQAALVLANPEAAKDSFYLLYPQWALMPMVLLATLASVIASQAVITGAFSLTHQAMQLGLLPRLHVKYTSEEQAGQIYMPRVNWLLLIGVILLIEIFKTSSNLAAAYGIAVTATMTIDALLLFIVMTKLWRWSNGLAFAVVSPLIFIDLAFLGSNLTKFFHGGFVPVFFSLAVIIMIRTWVRGTASLREQERDQRNTMESVMRELRHYPVARVSGTAVYLTSNIAYAPSALLQNLKHNKVLHEQNLLLTLEFARTPHVAEEERLRIENLPDGFVRVFLKYGFMEQPNVTHGIRLLRHHGFTLDMMHTTFFISRRNIMPSSRFGMPLWQDRIYIHLSNNATDAADYFRIPLSRVVELGVQMTV